MSTLFPRSSASGTLGLAAACAIAVAAVSLAAQSPAPVERRGPASSSASAKKPAKAPALSPLTPRERVVQLLNRFSYGPTPGQVDQVLAGGTDQWLEQQVNPAAANDNTTGGRLGQLPTLNMSPAQAIAVFPDRPQVTLVAQGKAPYPTDPAQKAVMEMQVARWQAEQDKKKADGSASPPPEPTDAEKAAKKQADQARASELFGQIYQLPKQQRMAAILGLSVPDRIVLADNGNLRGDQRNQLVGEFTPRERETFQAMSGNVSSSGNIANELAQGRMLRDILTERQLQAVMTDFWFNHFNVFVYKDSDQWYTTSYERDAIRRNALGSFKDLLLATAESPAMMVYLDNWLSIGPDSIANGVNPANPRSRKGNKGLNENYGREVMELHTVGVDGGYSQADVTALSAILTGWGVNNPTNAGGFQFDPKRHQPGAKVWYGYRIAEDGTATKLAPGANVAAIQAADRQMAAAETVTPDAVKQGITALTILANSPKTAHFISYLLVQYFVADTPPPALVDRLTANFLQTNGDIKSLLRTIATSPEFNSRQYFHNKVKTPVEFLASSFRASATDPVNAGALVNTCQQMGMPLYRALPPTGYYLTADQWMNSTALVDRLNFAYQLTNSKYYNQKFDSPRLLAMGLMSPAAPKPAAGAKPVSLTPDASLPGPQVALKVLEATLIGAPVTPKTNQLIQVQLDKQPPNASASDTLNLLTALVIGSPDFQLR